MPGLLRGVARTAVIAGTATHVSNSVSRRQAKRWARAGAGAVPARTAGVRRAASRRGRPRQADRAAQGAGRPEGAGHPHRGGVRGPEGRDPGRLRLGRRTDRRSAGFADLESRFGNKYICEDVPDHKLPQSGHAGRRRDAADRPGADPGRRPAAQPRDVRDHVDGARGAADHRREPAPQLHRPRRVPAHGRDRAALHQDAGRPLPRARRDHGRAHAGLLRGDHAGRARAQVEVAQAPRGGRQAHRPAEPGVRRRRARRVGEVLPLLRRRAAHRARSRRASTRSAPRTSSRTSTRTRSASRPCSAPPSPATPTTSWASTTCWWG